MGVNPPRSTAIETSFLLLKEEAEGMLRFAGPGQSVWGLMGSSGICDG
jgi:hypothetical protein